MENNVTAMRIALLLHTVLRPLPTEDQEAIFRRLIESYVAAGPTFGIQFLAELQNKLEQPDFNILRFYKEAERADGEADPEWN